MGKRKNKKHRPYTGPVTRQQIQAKQQERELREAQQGILETSDAEINFEVSEDDLSGGESEMAYTSDPVLPQAEKEEKRRNYVFDTNLILSCVDVIYDAKDEDWRKPLGFKPNLDNAHIIIPYTVFEELNHIKKEKTLRGMIARIAVDRLKKFFPNSGRSIGEIMYLEDPIPTGWKNQTISLLPIHRNFSKILPFVPDKDDNDGWIAVTALVATLLNEGKPVDGNQVDILGHRNDKKDVVLLTNDNNLLSKADLFGVRVKSYSFEKRPPFTGCRELVVPAEMFAQFYHEEKLSHEEFEEFMPNETPLIANEYIVMRPENDAYPRGYFTSGNASHMQNIARYHKENDMLYPLRFLKREGRDAPNAGIATYFDALNDDNIQVVNVTGDAGTGKTYQAIMYAIRTLKDGKYARAVLIPSRSAKNPLGALPGGQNQKMEPLVAAVKDAIRSYLASTPEFIAKREELRRHGDNDNATDETEDVRGDVYDKKGKKHSDHSQRNSRRTLGAFTGSYDDLDFGTNDYAPEDFGDGGHSRKKKDKTYYPGKNDKKGNDGEGKMTYTELLDKRTNYLFYRYFISMPYEDAQGHSFEDSIIILDEAQRIMIDDADTLLSRPAKNSKLIVCGDISQIHESSAEKQFNNGLNYSQMLFMDWEGCANIHLTKNLRGDIAHIMMKNRRKVRRMMGQI
jgi:predicted ribonuclease YlaK